MAAAAVSIDPSLYHSHSHPHSHSHSHPHHHYSPYSQHHSHPHPSSVASPSGAAVASLASALSVAGGAGGGGMGLLAGMNAHSVNALAAYRSQAGTPMHATAAAVQSHHNGGFPNFSAASTPSSFVPLYPPMYPMAQAAAVPISSSSSLSMAASSAPSFSLFQAGNATSSLSAWPPGTASFPSSSHVSRVVTPDSSPSTPTHFGSSSSAAAWSDRLMPLAAHTFSMQHSGASEDYPMSASKDDSSSAAHDGLSEHSADKDDSSAHSSSHLLMSRSSQLNSRHLPAQARDQVSRRRSSSNTSAASGGSAIDDKHLEALLKSIRLSVAKMDELIASSPAALSGASIASTASASSASSSPSTSPVLRPSNTAALEDIKALLINAANAVSATKKRKSVDESGDGVDSPMKRRITADDDDEDGEDAADGGFALQEVNGSTGMADEEDDDDEAGAADDDDSPRTQCKPCPLVESINKKPLRVLYVNVQRQYTVSKKETVRMSKEDKERLVPVHVRIMGTPARGELYFVAKDVCLLIHTRKGNVAKSIGQFREDEKVRMSVVCPRSNGTVSTHILTALTVKGVKRLLTTSRSPLASHVLKWIMKQVDVIMAEYAEERKQRQMKKLAAAAASTPQQPPKEAAGVAMRKSSQESDSSRASFNSNKTSPSSSPATTGLHSAPVVSLAPLSPLDVPTVAPFMPQEPSPIVKPSPLNYRLSPSSSISASQQLSVMVGQQLLLSQPDRKTTSSLPNSPTRTAAATAGSLPGSLLVSTPSTPTSGRASIVAAPSPNTAARSAFSKVPSFTEADANKKPGDAVMDAGRVSPTGAAKATEGVSGGVPAVGKASGKLTSLLEAIKVQNVDSK